MNNTELIAQINALLSIDAAKALVPHGLGGHAKTLLKAAADALEAAQPAPQTADVQQIVHALERAIAALEAQADKLAREHDYSAEFPAEDALRLRDAIALLKAHPAPQTAEERIADIHGVIVALRKELREEAADEADPLGDYADANRPSYAEKFGEPAGANPAPQVQMTDEEQIKFLKERSAYHLKNFQKLSRDEMLHFLPAMLANKDLAMRHHKIEIKEVCAPQVPMTDADIAELYFSITHQRLERLASPDSWVHKFARAVEAYHKIGVKP